MSRPPVLPDRLSLSGPVRRVFRQARREAVHLRQGYVGTEHLLLALLRAAPPALVGLLERLGVSPPEVAYALETARPAGTDRDSPMDPRRLPFTRRARQVMERMIRAAHDAGDRSVAPGHLFFALLEEQGGTASQVCRTLGVTHERARAAWSELVGAPDTDVPVRVDDGSDQPIYEQIAAQIQEQVATGALRPGARLPTVRRLADRLDIAPGTVARAYADLERAGVVVTGGARGTRVADRGPAFGPGEVRSEALVGLLRPVAVAAFHLGATADQLRASLDEAMRDIFAGGPKAAG